MKKLNLEQMEVVQGGISREKYCDQLYTFLDWHLNGTGNFQGDVEMVVWALNRYCL